jgi:hypothetical protein
MRGLHLCVARVTAKPTKGTNGWFGWRPRHHIHGGERPAADERWCYARFRKNKKEAAMGEIDASGPMWTTTAASLVEGESEPCESI